MTVPFELKGAAAVLTGAGSGIGRATALALAARGAKVAVSDLDRERAEQTAADVAAAGGEAIAVRVDVAQQGDLEDLRDRCLERFGRVDVVFNNVGVLAMGAPESLPVEAWQRVLDLNVLSIARSNLVFLPLLLEQGRGHVVNTSSASGLLAYGFDRLPYVASKHAVVGHLRSPRAVPGAEGHRAHLCLPIGCRDEHPRADHGLWRPLHRRGPRSIRSSKPEAVGELVAEAVTAGRFLVVTAPEIHDELLERATDLEAYMQRMIQEQES